MKTIKSKILLCMTSTIIALLFISGVTSIWLNYSSTMETLEQSMRETVTVAADRTTHELAAYTNVAIDSGCIARLADPAATVEAKKAIVDQRSKMHGFQRGNILTTDGISIFDGKDYSSREYFQEAMKGNAHVSEPLISNITGELTVIVAAPLWEGGIPDTTVIGVIYFVPTETFLNDIVNTIKVSENATAFILDENGTTIAHPVIDNVKEQENVIESAKNDPTFSELAQLESDMITGSSGFGSYKYDGANKFIAYGPIAGTDGWSLAVTSPSGDFLGSTYQGIFITVVLLLVSILVAVFISFKLSNGIGRPIKVCTDRLEQLSKGDLQTEIPEINSKDETGRLSAATHSIVSTMRGIVRDISWGLSEMGDGNFAIDSQAKELYVGDFENMAVSMYKILSQLNTTLLQINVSAEQVASGSDQVASGAQALSQGATEQASSVQELAATINQISDHVKRNAQNAQDARNMSETAASDVSVGNEKMIEMNQAIAQINEKSNEISKIIKTIEDIAFQTNILALNAAVEAARAGEAGKGFAVVADEVRNLASKSAEAAKNTTSLIEESVNAVQSGTKIADETTQAMLSVVSNTEKVAELIEDIAKASDDQALSISQITQGIDQIASVVQTNSATSEESAATSEELSSQAQTLKTLIGHFKLNPDMADVSTLSSDLGTHHYQHEEVSVEAPVQMHMSPSVNTAAKAATHFEAAPPQNPVSTPISSDSKY